MRIGLITTLNTNIGDDLIREGICMVLREIFKQQKIEFVPVNKHQPYTVYPRWHPIRCTRPGQHMLASVTSQFGFSHFDHCDLIVQCGAPVLWPGCHRCEWAEPLWHHVIGRLSKRTPVLNLAAGSCYPWERQPTYFTDPKDEAYLRSISGYCCLTTVRDRVAQRLYASLDAHIPLIPCSAFVAAGDRVVEVRDEGIVLINYMRGGGHYEWGQSIDPSVWEATIRTLIDRLKTRHRLAFLCHNKREYDLTWNVNPAMPRIWPRDPHEYFALVSQVKVALCNRMHASVALASLGIPSIAVGTDTRLLMVDAIGLPCFYVKEPTFDQLEDVIENLLANRRQEKERLLLLRSETRSKYVKAVAESIY